MEYIINAERLSEKAAAHAYLKEIMGFPEYYGGNLDALYDCLGDMGKCTVIFENTENAGEYFEPVFETFADAAEDFKRISVKKL